jgi:small subunit ribosomal protein S6
MSKYELVYILPSTLAETEVPAKATELATILKKHGANISSELDLGKKKLAYPINKDRYGYYRLMELEIEPTKLKSLDEELRLSRQLLRHLFTVKPVKSEEQLAKERALREKLAAKRQREEMTSASPTSEPLADAAPISAEELDKKLEKVLEEEPNL